MKKTYVAPELFVEEFVADTMIASGCGTVSDGYNCKEGTDGEWAGDQDGDGLLCIGWKG